MNQIIDKMLPANKLQSIIASVLLIFTVLSCSDSSTGVDSNDQKAIINGSVEGESSQGKTLAEKSNHAGRTVSAAQITSNGSVEVIEGTETETDASGNFSVEVDAAAANHIAVVAEGAAGQTTAFVAAEMENNNSYTVKPLNAESTAETSIYAEVVARGDADIVQKADIDLLVSHEAATEINSGNTSAAEIAAAFSNNAEARSEFYSEFSSSSNLESALESITEAHIQYTHDLDESGSFDEGAFETFMNTTIQAYADAGIGASGAAKLFHLQTEVLLKSINSVSADVENSVRASSSMMASIALDSAVRAHAESSSVSEATLDAIVNAGTELKTSVESSSGVSSEISGAFGTYHQDIRTAFENDGSVESLIIVAVDTEINAAGGAKLDFENSLSSLLQLTSVVSIYTDFSAEVQSSVETQSELLGDAEVGADVITDIVVLMNLFA